MEVIISGVPHVPIEEAASELHTTPLRLLMMLKKKVMRGAEMEGRWYIDKASLGCFQGRDPEDEKKGCLSSCRACPGK